MLTMALAIGGTGQTIALTGSVGRGGKNLRRDVSAICVRLLALGFTPAHSRPSSKPRSSATSAKSSARAARTAGSTPAGARSRRSPRASAPPHRSRGTRPRRPPRPPRTPASAPAAQPSGPRAPLADPALERLVSGNPAAEAAAAELAALETRFKGRQARERQRGDRARPATTSSPAWLAAREGRDARTGAATALLPRDERDLAVLLPEEQHHPGVRSQGRRTHAWNTCNITSLAMALEALGKTARRLQAQGAAAADRRGVQGRDRRPREDKVGAELAGLRLPGLRRDGGDRVADGLQDRRQRRDPQRRQRRLQRVPERGRDRHPREGLRRPRPSTASSSSTRPTSRTRAASILKGYGHSHWKCGDGLAKGALTEGKIEEDLPLEPTRPTCWPTSARTWTAAARSSSPGAPLRAPASRDRRLHRQGRPRPLHHVNAEPTWEEARALGLFQHWIAIG